MVKYGTPGGRASRVADWSQKPRTESGLPANQSHEDEGMAAEPTQPEGNEKEVGKRGAVYKAQPEIPQEQEVNRGNP